MYTELKTRNVESFDKIEKAIRKNSIENDGQYLEIIKEVINWDDISSTVLRNICSINEEVLGNGNTKVLIKCLALKEILGYSDIQLASEISKKKIYRDFIGAKSKTKIPNAELISSFLDSLIEEGLFGTVIIKLRKYLYDAKMNIIEKIVGKDIERLSKSGPDLKDKDEISEHVKLEIKERLKIIYSKMMDSVLLEDGKDTSKNIKEKLATVNEQIEELLAKNENKEAQNIQNLLNIERSVYDIYKISLKLVQDINEQKSNSLPNKGVNENKEIQLFIPFYKALDEYMSSMKADNVKSNASPDNVISDKLKSADERIKEFLDGISIVSDIAVSESKIAGHGIKQISSPSEKYTFSDEEELIREEKAETGKPESEMAEPETESEKDKEPLVLTPGFKKEGIFNDENLTEDYELGFRFNKLGLKMGFFNVKLDYHNESSRISTAEFFPNKFWPSVKQRSRWIAGICLQNWKINKWNGNLATKYFLFRDRKPLFSLFGAFFSNIILIYLVYTAIAGNFFNANINPLIDTSSVLIYLIFANMFFMVSRASHRFIFTYNWYGFKYAFFSFFRLILDTFINFAAVLRSLKVFRQTKKKVVWDSTTHY